MSGPPYTTFRDAIKQRNKKNSKQSNYGLNLIFPKITNSSYFEIRLSKFKDSELQPHF